jgi:hypothetical protein
MRNLLSISIILITLVVFFNKIIFFNQIYTTGDFLRSDTLHQNLPFKYTLYQSLRKGQFPLWTNQIFNGFPLLAEGQTGTFYPFNLIPFLLLPFVTAYNLSIFLNFVWAALGMFFLARSFGLKSFPSLISSISFALSSLFVLHITHHNIVSSACWLPFLFLSFKKLLETEKIRYLISTSVIITFTIFAGSFQIIFYMLFLAFFFFLFYSRSFRLNTKKFIFFYFLTIFLGLLLSSIQLLPTLELIRNSTRQAGLGNIAFDSLPYHPRNLITFIFPYVFGDPGGGTYPHFGGSWGMFWENTAYVGLITLALAVLTLIFLIKDKVSNLTTIVVKNVTEIKSLWFFLVVTVLLALGKYGPFFWIYYLPGFNMFRVTARFLLFVVFSLSLLAGFGLELVCQKIKNFYLKTTINLFVLLVLLIDLFLFGYNYNPTAKAELILGKPPAAKFLEKQLGKAERIFSVVDFLTYDEINKNGWRNNLKENLNHKNSLGPNINMLWGIENSDGYSGLFLQRNEIFKNIIYQGISLNDNKIEISPNSLKLLGLANTKFLISAFDIFGEGVEKINKFAESSKTYKVYKNNFYLPKGILIDDFKSGERRTIFSRLSSDEFDPKNELLLEAFPIQTIEKNSVNPSVTKKIKLKENKDEYFVFDITTDSSQYFLFQETNYPGWVAYVNGKETPIYPADGMFMAVRLPKGQSILEFVYQPGSFYLGACILIFTLLVLITIFSFFPFFLSYISSNPQFP